MRKKAGLSGTGGNAIPQRSAYRQLSHWLIMNQNLAAGEAVPKFWAAGGKAAASLTRQEAARVCEAVVGLLAPLS